MSKCKKLICFHSWKFSAYTKSRTTCISCGAYLDRCIQTGCQATNKTRLQPSHLHALEVCDLLLQSKLTKNPFFCWRWKDVRVESLQQPPGKDSTLRKTRGAAAGLLLRAPGRFLSPSRRRREAFVCNVRRKSQSWGSKRWPWLTKTHWRLV